ncbi:MAG TPA: hypothetical protein VFN11_00835 [Ktedonobacterales bacterium]|nr:hypothetical protein [Ktedonobacterales bacterium]
MIWLALVIPALGLFVVSLPAYDALVQRPCAETTTCNLTGALNTQGLAQLSAIGIPTASYAAFLTVFFAIIVAIWSGIGFLIFWRRPNDWFALFTALFLVLFNTTYPGFPISALAIAHPALNLIISLLGALGVWSIIAFMVLFPNGRLVPRWMGLILVVGALGALTTAFPNLPGVIDMNAGPAWLSALFNLPQYAAIIFAQIYRYRKVSTPVERQQTKWVVFGIVIAMAGISILPVILGVVLPGFNQTNVPAAVFLGLVAYPLVLLALPITVGIAILRSRLYDIDVIINRTLVYGSLTLFLGALYFALITGLEFVMRRFTGQGGGSPIAITLSTLAIYVLVQPLRRRLQTIIDRRFYRRKYDAARTLAAFGATQRNEVDLNALGDHLLAAVRETMQPAHVSLWLRPPESATRRRTGEEAQ